MSRSFARDYFVEIQRGEVSNFRIERRTGRAEVDTTLRPITSSGEYRMPSSPVALEILSDNANDTAAGSGARSVKVIGLDASWLPVEQTVPTAGLTPVSVPTPLLRNIEFLVEASGSYADTATGSHAGILTLREVAGGSLWSTIPLTTASGYGSGVAQIGAYTVPIGYTAWLLSRNVTVFTSKTVKSFFAVRESADAVTPPFAAARVLTSETGLAQPWQPLPRSPIGPFAGPTDMFFLAAVTSTTAEVLVDMEILLQTP